MDRSRKGMNFTRKKVFEVLVQHSNIRTSQVIPISFKAMGSICLTWAIKYFLTVIRVSWKKYMPQGLNQPTVTFSLIYLWWITAPGISLFASRPVILEAQAPTLWVYQSRLGSCGLSGGFSRHFMIFETLILTFELPGQGYIDLRFDVFDFICWSLTFSSSPPRIKVTLIWRALTFSLVGPTTKVTYF